jgi:hypothetical protein
MGEQEQFVTVKTEQVQPLRNLPNDNYGCFMNAPIQSFFAIPGVRFAFFQFTEDELKEIARNRIANETDERTKQYIEKDLRVVLELRNLLMGLQFGDESLRLGISSLRSVMREGRSEDDHYFVGGRSCGTDIFFGEAFNAIRSFPELGQIIKDCEVYSRYEENGRVYFDNDNASQYLGVEPVRKAEVQVNEAEVLQARSRGIEIEAIYKELDYFAPVMSFIDDDKVLKINGVVDRGGYIQTLVKPSILTVAIDTNTKPLGEAAEGLRGIGLQREMLIEGEKYTLVASHSYKMGYGSAGHFTATRRTVDGKSFHKFDDLRGVKPVAVKDVMRTINVGGMAHYVKNSELDRFYPKEIQIPKRVYEEIRKRKGLSVAPIQAKTITQQPRVISTPPIPKTSVAQQKLEEDRIAREKEAEQIKLIQQREKLEQERIAQQKADKEKADREKANREKLEKRRLEQKKVAQEKAERRRELRRQRREQQRAERERIKKEREQERREKQKQEQERIDRERLEKQKIEQQKLIEAGPQKPDVASIPVSQESTPEASDETQKPSVPAREDVANKKDFIRSIFDNESSSVMNSNGIGVSGGVSLQEDIELLSAVKNGLNDEREAIEDRICASAVLLITAGLDCKYKPTIGVNLEKSGGKSVTIRSFVDDSPAREWATKNNITIGSEIVFKGEYGENVESCLEHIREHSLGTGHIDIERTKLLKIDSDGNKVEVKDRNEKKRILKEFCEINPKYYDRDGNDVEIEEVKKSLLETVERELNSVLIKERGQRLSTLRSANGRFDRERENTNPKGFVAGL